MKRISYNLVLETYYPDAIWTIAEGGKGYQYDSYIWDSSNSVSKPSQATLDSKWEQIKRNTDLWSIFLAKRNQLLADTDYLMLPDYPHASNQVRQAWIDYRQALRDLPSVQDPTYGADGKVTIEWPTTPQ
jgi:hypothetical protein